MSPLFGGSKQQGGLTEQIARARLNLGDAVGSSEPQALARTIVREAWQLVSTTGLAWLTLDERGIAVGAQAPGDVVHPMGLQNSVIRRAADAKRPFRSVLRGDPALVSRHASVLVVAMRTRAQATGLLVAVRAPNDPFSVADEHALDSLLRAAAEVLGKPAEQIEMPPVALLRLDLFWPQEPTDGARESAVQAAGHVVRNSIRPTDELRRIETAAMEVILKRPTPETVQIVSQRLHQAFTTHIAELHNARWSIIPIEAAT